MKALRIEPEDNVAVVAQDTRKGDVLRHAGGEVTALTLFPCVSTRSVH